MAVKDHIDLIAPIVDTQPAYNLLHVVKSGSRPDSMYSRAHVAFARFKVKEAIRSMREAADHLEQQLGE